MILAYDIETRGLDARKFIMGSLAFMNKKKTEIYYDKKELFERIKQIAINERKRGKTTKVYACNAQFDLVSITQLDNNHWTIINMNPNAFIIEYYQTPRTQRNNKERPLITFYDIISLYGSSLKELGETINYKKKEMPSKLKRGETITNLKEVEEYCKRDSEIIIKAIKHLKNKLKKDKIKIRRYITTSQIATNYILQKLKQYDDGRRLFWNLKKNQLVKTLNPKLVQSAYRIGRNEIFKQGQTKNVTAIDINSLFPYALINIQIPNLRTQLYLKKPLSNGWSFSEIITRIGISTCLVENLKDPYGLLQINTEKGTYNPKIGKYLIGTWTHDELREAILYDDYRIHRIYESVIYKPLENNPFEQIITTLYQKRIYGKKYDKWFYKQMMNRFIGKLGQKNKRSQTIIDHIDLYDYYTKNGYVAIRQIENKYVYQKTEVLNTQKKYHCPIISAKVTAKANIIMWHWLRHIPTYDLVYTDIDSIFFTGNHINKFPISNNLGDFKIVIKNATITLPTRKHYCIGTIVKAAGIRKTHQKAKKFHTGKLIETKMITINTANKFDEIGKFTTRTRHVNKLAKKTFETDEDLRNRKIYIDKTIKTNTEALIYLMKEIPPANKSQGEIKVRK